MTTPASARTPSVWVDVLPLGPRARPSRVACPVCARWVRVGYAAQRPVVGQHHGGDSGPSAVDHEHAGCCRCPGSYAPVREDDVVEHTRARALGHPVTGQLPAVPAAVLAVIPVPRTATP